MLKISPYILDNFAYNMVQTLDSKKKDTKSNPNIYYILYILTIRKVLKRFKNKK